MEYAILSRAVHERISGKVAFEKRLEERKASEPWRGTGRKI